MTFGQTIAATRKELDISQRELASRILKEDGVPISAQYLNDIERERRNPPGDHLLEQFAKELELDNDYLFFLSGKLPSDVRAAGTSPKKVQEAFKAFRRTIGGK